MRQRLVTARSEATRQSMHLKFMDCFTSFAMTGTWFALTGLWFALTGLWFAMTQKWPAMTGMGHGDNPGDYPLGLLQFVGPCLQAIGLVPTNCLLGLAKSCELLLDLG